VYNVIRSATFGGNAPLRLVSVPDQDARNLAINHGKNGIEGFTLSHTRRF